MCNADAHRDAETPDVTDSYSRTEALAGMVIHFFMAVYVYDYYSG